MRYLRMLSIFLLGGLFLHAPKSFSQEMKDQMFLIHEEVVNINMWDKYESTSKEWVELMNGAGLDLPYIQASQRDDGHYYYIIPIANYAEIDKMQGIFNSAIEKVGKEKWGKFMIENNSTIESSKDFIATRSAKYSYMPADPRTKQEDVKFIHWMFFTYKMENRKEVMDILSEWKKLYEDKKIKSGYQIWLIELGLDNNMIALTEGYKDGADFYTSQQADNALMEKEAGALWTKMSQFITSIDNKYGNPRPDLGYVKK
jgi:hypothetical protein